MRLASVLQSGVLRGQGDVGSGEVLPGVGMVVIGNEILTGKVVDENSPFLCKELRQLGVDVHRITTIPDDFDEIGRTVRDYSQRHTWVFTSGGIGPTHDDITIQAIAAGFGVEAARHPVLEQALRAHYGERLTEDHLLMAVVPEGGELIEIPGFSFHQVRFRNVFIMPGVPQLFRQRLNTVKRLLSGHPTLLRQIFLKADEGTIAGALRHAAEQYPDVQIGSYPNFTRKEYSVMVTVEARAEEPFRAALADLQSALEALPITIVRTE